MSIFDDIGKAFEDAFNAVKDAATTVFEVIIDGVETVVNYAFVASDTVVHFVEGVGYVVAREVSNAAGEVAKGADQAWTAIVAAVDGKKVRVPVISTGQRVRDKKGDIYVLLDGQLRHIPDPATYDNLYPDKTGILEVDKAADYPVGEPLGAGAYLAAGTPDGRVFLVSGGSKRWIISAYVFNRFGFSWKAIRTLSEAALGAIPESRPVSGEYVPNGRRVTDKSTGAVYLMIDDELRHIPNAATYNLLFRDWKGIAELANPQGHRRGAALADGAYLAKGSPDGRVFLVDGGAKRWITGPPVMDRFHFSWTAVRSLPAAQLTAMPDGPAIA